MATSFKRIALSTLVAGGLTIPAGCKQTAAIPPGGSFGAFGSATPAMVPGQGATAMSVPSMTGITRVTPPTSATLGAPTMVPAAGGYLAPVPSAGFQINSGVPASSPMPTTNTFGAASTGMDINQYGSVPMGNALDRQRSVAVVNQVQPLPSTQPLAQPSIRPAASGIQQTAFTADNDLQWRNPADGR